MDRSGIIKMAVDKADDTMSTNKGGPFGAAIVKDDKVICVTSNSVLCDNDPTAHAEINAIRKACKILGTYDLAGCELYATGYPCPMCMSAVIWANIKKIYVCAMPKDAEKIGFRDDFIYNFIKENCENIKVLDIEKLDSTPVIKLYEKYEKLNKTVY